MPVVKAYLPKRLFPVRGAQVGVTLDYPGRSVNVGPSSLSGGVSLCAPDGTVLLTLSVTANFTYTWNGFSYNVDVSSATFTESGSEDAPLGSSTTTTYGSGISGNNTTPGLRQDLPVRTSGSSTLGYVYAYTLVRLVNVPGGSYFQGERSNPFVDFRSIFTCGLATRPEAFIGTFSDENTAHPSYKFIYDQDRDTTEAPIPYPTNLITAQDNPVTFSSAQSLARKIARLQGITHSAGDFDNSILFGRLNFNDVSIVKTHWDWGDGTTSEITGVGEGEHEYGDGDGPLPIYNGSGTLLGNGYLVTQTVTDNYNNSDSVSRPVLVNADAGRIGMLHDATGALFTAVRVGTSTKIYKFTAGVSTRQEVASLALKNPALFAHGARFFVAGDDELGYRIRTTSNWFKTFSSPMLIWPTTYKPNADVCGTKGGGAASAVLKQNGSTLEVWSRTSVDGLTWPSTGVGAPVLVGALPANTTSKTLRIQQLIIKGSLILQITNGSEALWRSSNMGRTWTAVA